MTHQSPKTHRDPPEPRLLDDGFLVESEERHRVERRDGWMVCTNPTCSYMRPGTRYPGWALDDLEPPPVAPITRRAAFVGFVVCVAVLAAVVVWLVWLVSGVR